MKLRNFLACSISAVMLFSGIVANAELTVQDDADLGGKVATSIPTNDEILARTPALSAEVLKLADQAAVKAATTNAWSLKHKVANYDVYKVDFVFADLGDLYNGYNTDYDNVQAGIGLLAASLPLGDLTINADSDVYVNGAAITGGTLEAGVKDGNLNVQWATASTGNPYPYMDPAEGVPVYEADASITLTAVIALPVGTTLESDFANGANTIAYTVNYSNIKVPFASIQETVVLGEKEPEPEPEPDPEPVADVEIALVEGYDSYKYDNGYVWNVTVNKDMETFGIKFYSGDYSTEKSVKNVENLPKLGGGVGYKFNVGLKTAKTLDQADFTADDYTATWPEVK